MQQEDSFQSTSFQFPLPGQQPGHYGRHGPQDCAAEVVVGRQPEFLSASPGGDEVEGDAGDKKRNGKMNDYYVLRVLGENGCTRIPGIHLVLLKCSGKGRTEVSACLGLLPYDHWTTTLPVIFGWIEQK